MQSSLTQFGTYGFLSALLAAQIASAPKLFAANGVPLKKAASSKSVGKVKKSSHAAK